MMVTMVKHKYCYCVHVLLLCPCCPQNEHVRVFFVVYSEVIGTRRLNIGGGMMLAEVMTLVVDRQGLESPPCKTVVAFGTDKVSVLL